MIHSAAQDPSHEDACRRAAARLQRDHQHWMVMWGCYTRRYVAFPLFPAPRGTILTAVAPAELAAKMRRQERSAGMWAAPPGPVPGRQQERDWPGRRSLGPVGLPGRASARPGR
jgi:hypothetical protein